MHLKNVDLPEPDGPTMHQHLAALDSQRDALTLSAPRSLCRPVRRQPSLSWMLPDRPLRLGQRFELLGRGGSMVRRIVIHHDMPSAVDASVRPSGIRSRRPSWPGPSCSHRCA